MDALIPRYIPLPFRSAVLAGAWSLLASACCAERLFVGIMEADGYQSAIYGASAFSRISDLPLVQEWVQNSLAKNLALPSFNGISASDTLRIVQTVDSALPLSADNPANVALIPLIDDGTAVLQAFASAYTTKTPLPPVILFEHPSDTNLPPCVAVAVADRHLFTSLSRDALAWAWENRAKLIEAPPQSLPGTFRVLVNPQRFADLLGARSEKATAVLNVDRLFRDFETLAFSLTLEGPALAFTLRGCPKKDSSLEALVSSWRRPLPTLWNGVPDNAFFASLTASGDPDLWAPYLGKARSQLLRPLAGLVPHTALSGDSLLYISPTSNRQGFCFVQLEPVKDKAAVLAAIQQLDKADKNGAVWFTKKTQRQIAGVPIETYAINLQAPQASPDNKSPDRSIVFTVLSLFLKKAVLETAVVNGYLVTVIAPANTLEEVRPPAIFSDRQLTLDRKIRAQDSSLSEHLTLGGSLHLAGLLRHLVSILPEVKPEQVLLLPKGGDGATFGISLTDRTLTASLRFQSNEIAALQRINRDGRALFQELFFQMFANQMMEMRQPAGAPPKAKAP